MIGPPLDEPPPDPFADRIPLPRLFLTEKEHEEKEARLRKKEAERGRERRKLKRDQMAAIKEALKTPVREINRRAEELKRALESETTDMNKGSFLTGAATGKGELVYSGRIDQVAAMNDRTQGLRGPSSPEDTGYWEDNDRRRVEPEGTGEHGNGQRSNDETKVSNKSTPGLAFGVPVARTRFVVKLDTDLIRGQALLNLFHRLNEKGVCRLCYQECSERHVDTVHGDEDEPRHDKRYGNVIAPEVQKIKKGRR